MSDSRSWKLCRVTLVCIWAVKSYQNDQLICLNQFVLLPTFDTVQINAYSAKLYISYLAEIMSWQKCRPTCRFLANKVKLRVTWCILPSIRRVTDTRIISILWKASRPLSVCWFTAIIPCSSVPVMSTATRGRDLVQTKPVISHFQHRSALTAQQRPY